MQESVTHDIVREVALALGSGVSTSEAASGQVRSQDAYLRGRFLWNKRTLDSMEKSIVYYQYAINADPAFAEAYAAMGDAYVLLTSYGADPSSALGKADGSGSRTTLRLGGGWAEAEPYGFGCGEDRAGLGLAGSRGRVPAGAQFESFLSHCAPLVQFASFAAGKNREAEAEIQRARALDPLSPIISTDAAETAYWARKPDEADGAIEAVLARNPEFAEAYLAEGEILEQQGHYEQALAAYKNGSNLFGGASIYIEALQGKRPCVGRCVGAGARNSKAAGEHLGSPAMFLASISPLSTAHSASRIMPCVGSTGQSETGIGKWVCWAWIQYLMDAVVMCASRSY